MVLWKVAWDEEKCWTHTFQSRKHRYNFCAPGHNRCGKQHNCSSSLLHFIFSHWSGQQMPVQNGVPRTGRTYRVSTLKRKGQGSPSWPSSAAAVPAVPGGDTTGPGAKEEEPPLSPRPWRPGRAPPALPLPAPPRRRAGVTLPQRPGRGHTRGSGQGRRATAAAAFSSLPLCSSSRYRTRSSSSSFASEP